MISPLPFALMSILFGACGPAQASHAAPKRTIDGRTSITLIIRGKVIPAALHNDF